MIVIFIIIAVILVALWFYVMTSEWRDFKDDLITAIPDSEDCIVVREWSFLLGSGAEIYYRYSNGKEVRIGNAGGGDDGYLPFARETYKVQFQSDSVTFDWCWQYYRENDSKYWKSTTLQFP